MPISGRSFFSDHAFVGNNGSRTPVCIMPFTQLDLDDDVKVIDWVKGASGELMDYYQSYRDLYRSNIEMYVGAGLESTSLWGGQVHATTRVPPKAKTQLLRPIIESHVARLTSSRTNISVLPVHANDFSDIAAAKNAEQVIQQSFRSQNLNDKFEKAGRCTLVCGASYMLMEWDNALGPPLDILEEGIPVLDDEGNPKLDEEDQPIMIRPDIRMGDVGYRLLRPDQVLEQPGCWGQDVDWVIVLEMVDVYRLRQTYPTVAELIKPAGSQLADFGNSVSLNKTSENQALVYKIYHRATPHFPNGRQVICTDDVILENTDLPYPSLNKYSMLPIARLEDMSIPGYELPLPLTVMEAGKPFQYLHDRINHNILRNLSLQTPKWIVHSGSGVKLAHLNNATNVVQFKGDASMAPRMDSPRTTSGEVYNYRQQLQTEMQVATGSSHILNVPPPNTRAASMLEHQEEQEFRRSEPLIRHMNDFQANVARIALAIMADKYDDSDGRTIKLAGHMGSKAFLKLKIADLMGPFDIIFERTSALPESKQGRLNEAARLFQLGLISADQYKKIIGYNADPELADADTKAFEKQLLENDLIIRGHEIEVPLEFEDHVEHLKAIYPIVQSSEFAEMPDELKQRMVAHAMAHEMYAWRRAQVSQVYALKVLKDVQWLFFSALPEAMPVGINNPGTPVENLVTERLTTPGLVQPSQNIVPGPDSPESV